MGGSYSKSGSVTFGSIGVTFLRPFIFPVLIGRELPVPFKCFIEAAHFFIAALSCDKFHRVFRLLEEDGGLFHAALQYKCMEGSTVTDAELLLQLGLIDTEVPANKCHRHLPLEITVKMRPFCRSKPMSF